MAEARLVLRIVTTVVQVVLNAVLLNSTLRVGYLPERMHLLMSESLAAGMIMAGRARTQGPPSLLMRVVL